jgi:hypothetical protein
MKRYAQPEVKSWERQEVVDEGGQPWKGQEVVEQGVTEASPSRPAPGRLDDDFLIEPEETASQENLGGSAVSSSTSPSPFYLAYSIPWLPSLSFLPQFPVLPLSWLMG